MSDCNINLPLEAVVICTNLVLYQGKSHNVTTQQRNPVISPHSLNVMPIIIHRTVCNKILTYKFLLSSILKKYQWHMPHVGTMIMQSRSVKHQFNGTTELFPV